MKEHSVSEVPAGNTENRLLGRLLARELSNEEIGAVGGAAADCGLSGRDRKTGRPIYDQCDS